MEEQNVSAAIDIGTNTFNLLIANRSKSGLNIMESHKVAVSLGMGGINEGVLTADAIQRALDAFETFRGILLNYPSVQPILIATSAVRDAKNASAFITAVFERFAWEVTVVSGMREAELIYKGVGLCYDFKEHTMIMDIGGGSTEFIEANNEGICSEASLNIGVSRLYQGFSVNDPFSKADVQRIESFLEEHSNGLFENMDIPVLLGSSGTFETFYELMYRKPFPKGDQILELELESFISILDELIYSSLAERNENEFIIPIRKKMAPFAAVKTRWVLRQIKPKRILISPFSLKEGVLA
jgi:exopolyphosphatase/guanosine-5'-triphosphate,3'-diphosphate pyrophosphatase